MLYIRSLLSDLIICTNAVILSSLILSWFLSQIECVHPDMKIRRKTQADGSIACPGEIAVYLSDKSKYCFMPGEVKKPRTKLLVVVIIILLIQDCL